MGYTFPFQWKASSGLFSTVYQNTNKNYTLKHCPVAIVREALLISLGFRLSCLADAINTVTVVGAGMMTG